MRCPGCYHDNIPGADLCDSCGFDLAGLDVRAWGAQPRDPILTQPLSSLPLKEPLMLPPEASVAEAINLMNERREGCVFAIEGNAKPVGVFTERDVALRVVSRSRDPEKTALSDVMTPQPFVLHRDDALAFALHRMGVDGYRHIPIVEKGSMVGFLSMRTLLGVFARA